MAAMLSLLATESQLVADLGLPLDSDTTLRRATNVVCCMPLPMGFLPAELDLAMAGRRVRVAWVRRVRRRTTGQRAAAGEGEDEGVDEGVDAVGEQGAVRQRGAPLAGTADSSPVETPSGRPTTSCGRV